MGTVTHTKTNTTFKLGGRHKLILKKAVESGVYDSASDCVRTLIDRLETENGFLKHQVIPA